MSLVWTTSPDGSLTASHGTGSVRVAPMGSGPDSRWFAFDIDGQAIRCDLVGRNHVSWPSLAEAQSACERSRVRRRPGPKSTGVEDYTIHVTPEAMARLRARAKDLRITASQALQRLLMALPEVKP